MSSRNASAVNAAASWRWAFDAGPSGSPSQAICYVADDHGLGVEIDTGALDCRSLVAETWPPAAKTFCVAAE